MVYDSIDYSELVMSAREGDRASLDMLAERVRGKLYAYVYRIVMADDAAQDIVQESMLEMFKIFDRLESADKFWPWLRGIAFNKIRHHRKVEYRRRMVSTSNSSEEDWDVGTAKENMPDLANLMNEELKQIVFRAVSQLKPQHRAVLTMRCYEEMGYGEIAELMGCSEINVRVLLYRAKNSLYRHLSKRGLSKKFLLSALVLFGKMTAPSEAAATSISLATASTTIGAAAAIIGAVTSKSTIISVIAAGVIAVGTTVVKPQIDKAVSWLERQAVVLTERMAERTKIAATQGGEQYWYYYPDGPPGPVMTRLMKQDVRGGSYYCQRLETEESNYRYDEGTSTIYIENSRMWRKDLGLRQLPTDGGVLRQFYLMGRDKTSVMDHIVSAGENLLVVVTQADDKSESQQSYHRNILDEEYFQYDWPGWAQVADRRDQRHKRGWTYFTISGRMNGNEVSGLGRIPFVYAASRQHFPWLKLEVSGDLKLSDDWSQARVQRRDEKSSRWYRGGSMFKGLSRPWMGLHTLDTVRRDAVQEGFVFETDYSPASGKAEVVLTQGQNKLIYTIDMENDLIERIEFSVVDDQGRQALYRNGAGQAEGDPFGLVRRRSPRVAQGELQFSYLQDVEGVDDRFTEPVKTGYIGPLAEGPGLGWLVKLAEGDLGK
jgi:RNA polymerase sigma-70 factor (ECF subfamily)